MGNLKIEENPDFVQHMIIAKYYFLQILIKGETLPHFTSLSLVYDKALNVIKWLMLSNDSSRLEPRYPYPDLVTRIE